MASSIEDNAVRWKIRQGGLPEYQCASTFDAWLTFLSSDEPADIVKLVNAYPEFLSCYQDIMEFRRHPKELVTMYSEALAMMDRNLERYMVEESKKETEALKKVLNEALKEKDCALQERDRVLKEKDSALKEKDSALKEKDSALKEKDSALKEKDSALKEKENTIEELTNALNSLQMQMEQLQHNQK